MASGRSVTINIGFPWFTLWLFTVAFCHLTFGSAVFALIGWPYYLGEAVARIVAH